MRISGLWAALVGALCLLVAQQASGTVVEGKVAGYEHLRNPVWDAARRADSHGYSFREPVETVPARYRKLYPDISRELCIVAFDRNGRNASGAAQTVTVAGGRMSAMTLVIRPGTAIRFVNGDAFSHELFGVDIPSFPAVPLGPGKSRKWTLKEPGVYRVADKRAPSVQMWVIVKAGVADVAYPALDGTFSLSLANSGSYTLQAYFAGKPVGKSRPVQVSRRKVNLTRRPLVVASSPPAED